VDLVTVATPNSTHFEISKAFLEAGFNVLCEKPMTVTVAEGEDLVRLARKAGRICAVNYCYSAYPMVRQACARWCGRARSARCGWWSPNFSHGHHGDATDADNPRVRWRYDPAMAGVSGQFADCGIHALHMASFICDDEVEKLSADFASTIPSRVLEDDAMVNFRMSGARSGGCGPHRSPSGGSTGSTFRCSAKRAVSAGRQEQPNQLIYTPVGGRTQIMEKGEGGLHDDAKRLSRVAIAHPEGFPLAVANIYCDLADTIRGTARDGLPTAAAGVRSIAAVHAAVASAKAGGTWVEARPPMFR
jgi:predicted dehydrogenase